MENFITFCRKMPCQVVWSQDYHPKNHSSFLSSYSKEIQEEEKLELFGKKMCTRPNGDKYEQVLFIPGGGALFICIFAYYSNLISRAELVCCYNLVKILQMGAE